MTEHDVTELFRANESVINWLLAENLLETGDYDALRAVREHERVKREFAERVTAEATMARLLRDEREKAKIPLDVSLRHTPPCNEPADLIIARRSDLQLGTVRFDDDQRPMRVRVVGRFGWLTAPMRAAVEPLIGHLVRERAIGISPAGTPFDDLNALIRGCGFGAELDHANGHIFVRELFAEAGEEMGWTAAWVARLWLTARANGHDGLARVLQVIGASRFHDPSEVVQGRVAFRNSVLPVWPAWQSPAETEAQTA